jgi:hypothetical protein
MNTLGICLVLISVSEAGAAVAMFMVVRGLKNLR